MKREKHNFIWYFAVLFSVFLIMSGACVYAAGDVPAMWVEPSSSNGIPAQIDVFKASNTSYQIYLPGNADLSHCYLSWDGEMQATVGGTPYDSGSCPVPSPEDGAVSYAFGNGASVSITTYQGSLNVVPVFILVDESEGNQTIAEMDNDKDHETECTGTIYIDGQLYGMPKIKGRGNATWKEALDKKPYNVTLDTKINFPGIDSPTTKKWSFLAENLDRSLLGNRAGYYLAYEMGIGQDTASADVWMNGEYQGCYTVTPKTDSFVTKNGFMIEQDNYMEKSVAEGGDPQFSLEGLVSHVSGWSSCYNLITVKKMGDNLLLNNGVVDESPENMEAAALLIQDWLQDAWDAMRSDTGYNEKGKYYTEYIDIESFAKMYLMHEYVKSYDVCAGSILFYREGQSDTDKLIAGPLWDLDNAMGSVYQNSMLMKADDRTNGDRRSGEGDFIVNITNYKPMWGQAYDSEYKTSIYKTLGKHDDFMEEVVYQYNKYKAAFNSLSGDLQQMADGIEASAVMNHNKVEDLGNGDGKNNHYYGSNTTLGSGQYQQAYKKTPNAKTGWSVYVENMKTYVTTRSLWFSNNYTDPNYVEPENCTHAYEIIASVPATCTASGSATYKCPLCRDTYTEAVPQLPHNYQNGACADCGEVLLTAEINCSEGVSVTVYETQDLTGACEENASAAHPRSNETGLIDCSGEGQINFVINLDPGYELVSVTATPKNYKNLKDQGGNYYRITKVTGDFTITVTASDSHDWGDPVWTWAEDYSTATATFTCRRDASHVETVTASLADGTIVTDESLVPARYEDVEKPYTATVLFEGQAYTSVATQILNATHMVHEEQQSETGESITIQVKTDTLEVTVSSDNPEAISEESPVLVASFADDGRFLGAAVGTQAAEPIRTEENAKSVRIFWIDRLHAPKVKDMEVDRMTE